MQLQRKATKAVKAAVRKYMGKVYLSCQEYNAIPT